MDKEIRAGMSEDHEDETLDDALKVADEEVTSRKEQVFMISTCRRPY